ncbi:hypothetical protein H311_01642 [Anncaliia algerae PRA109]|nr:hypothetical protein H311_01642 [Anncaliia algerae PRA109]
MSMKMVLSYVVMSKLLKLIYCSQNLEENNELDQNSRRTNLKINLIPQSKKQDENNSSSILDSVKINKIRTCKIPKKTKISKDLVKSYKLDGVLGENISSIECLIYELKEIFKSMPENIHNASESNEEDLDTQNFEDKDDTGVSNENNSTKSSETFVEELEIDIYLNSHNKDEESREIKIDDKMNLDIHGITDEKSGKTENPEKGEPLSKKIKTELKDSLIQDWEKIDNENDKKDN